MFNFDLTQAFISTTVFLCLVIYVTSFVIRSIFESIWKVLVANGTLKQTVTLDRLWNEAFLPVLPIIVGGLLGFMAKTFIWPEITNGTRGGRILYAAVCGMFSSFVYNRIRAWLNSSPTKGSNSTEDAKSLPAVAEVKPPLYAVTAQKEVKLTLVEEPKKEVPVEAPVVPVEASVVPVEVPVEVPVTTDILVVTPPKS